MTENLPTFNLVKKEKRKRELSPPSPPPVFDEPAKKKDRPKQKAPPEKKKKEARDPESATVDLSDMKNIGLNRYAGIMEFKDTFRIINKKGK